MATTDNSIATHQEKEVHFSLTGATQTVISEIDVARRKSQLLADSRYFRHAPSITKKNPWTSRFQQVFLVSSLTIVNRSVFRSRYGILQERIRQINTFPWIFHPYSTLRWIWNILITMFLLASLLIQPIFVAFYSDVENGYNVEVSSILSTVFFLDIILNFRTGHVSQSTDAIILDYSYVARQYLKTWFLIDFLSSIPYDIIYYAVKNNLSITEDHEFYFKCLRIFELLNIFRLVRILRYLPRLQEAFDVNTLYIRIINLLIFVFIMIHWLACLHYLAADLVKNDNVSKELSWVTRMNLWNTSVSFRYLNCVVRALSNMGCLGYGLEVPFETEDILCTILSILVGATCFALFTGYLTNILFNVGMAEKQYTDVLNQAQDFMRFKQIPRDLQNRVILYYEQRYRRNFFNEQMILSSVSDVLRRELQMFTCRHLIEEVPIFQGLPQIIIQEIVSHLKFEIYFPPDIIVNALTYGDCMYFIEHGGVSIIDVDGREINRLGDGEFFGELGLLTRDKRMATVAATNFCEVYRLERADFQSSIENYPEIYDKIVQLAEERAGRTLNKLCKYTADRDPINTKDN